MEQLLTSKQRRQLLRELKLEKYARYSDRIKTILLLDDGEKYFDIAKFLFISERTARNYKKNYEEGGLEQLIMDDYDGGLSYLTSKQQDELTAHLAANLYRTATEICSYIKSKYDVEYTVGSVRHLLKRLGFVHKKPVKIPGKANKQAQREFVEVLEKLKNSKNPTYFADGVHPQHNTYCEYGWIQKGINFEIKSNTGRARINLNGAINANDPQDFVVVETDSVNAQSTIEMLKKIEAKHPKAKIINVVVDNARYYKNKLVKEYLESSCINLVFLPPYSPNLNLIERVWKVLKRKILYNQYFEKFADFRNAILGFFDDLSIHAHDIARVLNFKFHLVGN